MSKHRTEIGLALRLSATLLTAVVALVAFRLGVGVSERPGIPDASLAVQLYYVVGIFVLGGLDLGSPVGGPSAARMALWVSYFAGPLITTGAIVEVALRTLRPEWWRRLGLRNHVVVVGACRTGMLYMEAVREIDPDRRLLLVALERDRPDVAEAEARLGALFVQGDITHRPVREALRLERAAGVVLVTNHDLVNLDGAVGVLEDAPRLERRVVAHVADLALKRSVVEHGGLGIPSERIFNTHRVAAEHLVRHDLTEHFSHTAGRDVVVLAGFGRFGQTILEVLQEEAIGEVRSVVVVDRHAHRRLRQFDEAVGVRPGWTCSVVEGDIADPAIWGLVDTGLGLEEDETLRPIYVLGTDKDEVNLHAALRLRRNAPDAAVIARCFSDSGFAKRLAAEASVDVVAVGGLLRRSLAQRHREWFGDE